MGTATFDLVGLLAFTASAVLEALRCVLVQVLMGHLKYNAAEVRPSAVHYFSKPLRKTSRDLSRSRESEGFSFMKVRAWACSSRWRYQLALQSRSRNHVGHGRGNLSGADEAQHLQRQGLCGAGRIKASACIVQVLLFVGLPTGVMLAAAAVPSEGAGLAKYGWAIARENPGLLGLLALSSAAVNVTSVLAIRLTSSLMFKVTGCMKNVAVVWLGVLMGDKVRRSLQSPHQP